MEIEKLKDRLLEWDGVDTVDNGEFIEVDYHGVFDLLKEVATALDRLAAYEDTGFTPEEVQQMRWIPVEERFPEKGDWVLAAYQGKGGKPLVEIAIYNPKTKVHKRGGEVYVVLEGWYRNRDWSVCDMILDQVTHWMPLPKLPKEEPNGKK